jgi:hypothetical protein
MMINLNRGLANQRALEPGRNGWIDPHFEAGDRIDWDNLRIVSDTPDGRLHTLNLPAGVHAVGYAPDDRVRGRIVAPDGTLDPLTVQAMSRMMN